MNKILKYGVSVGIMLIQPAFGVMAETTLSYYPKQIDPSCLGGRALSFDECGLQSVVFNNALQEANKNNKTVLVVFGAEWCVPCHIFKQHIMGGYGKFRFVIEATTEYKMDEYATDLDAQQAGELAAFVARNFVLANIEAQHSFDGYNVLQDSSAGNEIGDAIPYVYSVDKNGQFLAELPYNHEMKTLDKRREGEDWFRGYHRDVLMVELGKLVR